MRTTCLGFSRHYACVIASTPAGSEAFTSAPKPVPQKRTHRLALNQFFNAAAVIRCLTAKHPIIYSKPANLSLWQSDRCQDPLQQYLLNVAHAKTPPKRQASYRTGRSSRRTSLLLNTPCAVTRVVTVRRSACRIRSRNCSAKYSRSIRA